MPMIEVKNGKKQAFVFQDDNKKWCGASLPFPSLELYGTDDDGTAVCRTRAEAVKAVEAAGGVVLSRKVVESYV